jgi:Glyoxalase-like domain
VLGEQVIGLREPGDDGLVELALDHVIVAVPDLAQAAAALERTVGLRASRGGRHPTLGTENMLVPLGGAYLEILAVADAGLAGSNEFGRAVLDVREAGPQFTGWVLRTGAIEDAAAQWESQVVSLSRDMPTGAQIRWRMAGLENARDRTRPLLIEWEDERTSPSFADPAHPVGPVALQHVEIGDPARLLGTWLPHIDHVRLTASGPAGVHALTLDCGGTRIVVTEDAFTGG